MKSQVIVLFIIINQLIISNPVSSQDRIVLKSGDTVECSIYRENRGYLFFRNQSHGVVTKGKVSKNDVKEWTYSVSKPLAEELNSEPSKWTESVNQSENTDMDLALFGNEKRWRFSMGGGPAFLLGNTEKGESQLTSQGVSAQKASQYYKDYSSGFAGFGSAHVFFARDLWLGATYQGFYSYASAIDQFNNIDNLYNFYGEIKERVFVQFPGLSFFSPYYLGRKKKLSLSSSLTIGPAFLRNEATVLLQEVLIKSTTLGQNYHLALEYFIQPRMSFSFGGNLFNAQARKINVITPTGSQEIKLEKGEYENISRFELLTNFIIYF
jgi:hypothetical protein